jgi:hypothetical protein
MVTNCGHAFPTWGAKQDLHAHKLPPVEQAGALADWMFGTNARYGDAPMKGGQLFRLAPPIANDVSRQGKKGIPSPCRHDEGGSFSSFKETTLPWLPFRFPVTIEAAWPRPVNRLL